VEKAEKPSTLTDVGSVQPRMSWK